jgi:putative membrane protein
MMWYGDGWWMMLWMLLFWAGIVLVLVWAVRGVFDGGRTSTGDRHTALEILEQRFARGEIDRDEFEQRRSALRGR